MNKGLAAVFIIGGIIVYGAVQGEQRDKHIYAASTPAAADTTVAAADVQPLSASKFRSLMQETGCDSTYSDLKKADLAAPYIGKPALVTGAVSYISGGDVGIKVNPNTLTYDVLITFANPHDTYDLRQNQTITAKFDFGDIGGCLMPFTGNNGEVR